MDEPITTVRLAASRRPRVVRLSLPADYIEAVGCELGGMARLDRDGCSGYFPSLEGQPGIVSDLPASRMFAARHPRVVAGGEVYGFSFLRFSSARQTAFGA
jgi:hypothetical protein